MRPAEKPLTLSKKVYASIYAVDTIFDDEPARWKPLAAKTPATAEDALAMKEPCRLIKDLIASKEFPFADIAAHPAMVQGFNALAYLARKAGEAGQEINPKQLTPLDKPKLLRHAERNLQCSLAARMVQETSTGTHSNAALLAALPVMLRDDFVGQDKPKARYTEAEWQRYATGRELPKGWFVQDGMVCEPVKGYNFDSAAAKRVGNAVENTLGSEQLKFLAAEWRDVFADLEMERKTGMATPNALVNYIRAEKPDADLQAWTQDVGRRFGGGQSGGWTQRLGLATGKADTGKVKPEALKAVDAGIHKVMMGYMNEHQCQEGCPAAYATLADKQRARSAREVQ